MFFEEKNCAKIPEDRFTENGNLTVEKNCDIRGNGHCFFFAKILLQQFLPIS